MTYFTGFRIDFCLCCPYAAFQLNCISLHHSCIFVFHCQDVVVFLHVSWDQVTLSSEDN